MAEELKAIKISELPAASELDDSSLLVAEQNGVAKKITGKQFKESAKGDTGPEGPAGKDGFSPTVYTHEITGGTEIIITDKSGTHTFNVMDGKQGPEGRAGQDGTDGKDGVSPTVSFSAIVGGIRMTVTDADGTKSIDVLNGKDGKDGNPIGTVISFMGLKAPKDYLICDGSVYSVSDYPDLAAFFKDQFGNETYFGSNGDGTFAVPDMRNLFVRGYHGSATALSGNIGKKQLGTLHPYIWTGYNSNKTSAFIWSQFPSDTSNNVNNSDSFDSNAAAISSHNTSNIQNTSGPSHYTARPVNMAVLYCIKAVDSHISYAHGEQYNV